jgi:arylsulfatase A-like enzyme
MNYKNYNIILINIDGFRKDKIELCKNLKEIQNESLYFSNMNTVAPYTFASLHSIFSGLYPSKHGVNGYYNIFKFKKEQITTFPELLQKNNYFTSYDIIDDSVIPSQGFNEKNIFDEKTVNFKTRHSKIIKELASKEKFFLFLHYTETHKRLVDAVIQKYNQESNDDEYFNNLKENDERFNSYLPYCDDYIKTIIETLKEEKIYDKTILILFADHGTSLGEKKGEKFYGVFCYDYTINVFCMMKIPNMEKQLIADQCRTTDIFPTILELAGIHLNPKLQLDGETLFSLVANPSTSEREVFAETGGLYGPWPSPEKHNVFCYKSNSKKLIYNKTPNTWEFYDLVSDPDELNNIYEKSSKLIKLYKQRLENHLKSNKTI